MKEIIQLKERKSVTNEANQWKEKHDKLQNENKSIYEALAYAATIQNGILPKERHFNRLFDEHFVIYRPLQLIGGDFYWVAAKNDKIFFATADCTGHGIGGAMLSTLGISFLNYVVLGKEIEDLGKILMEIDKKWIETFNQQSDLDENNDWMEISICSYNTLTGELLFAGANGNLLTTGDQGSEFYEGDKYPIGGWQLEKNRIFHQKRVSLDRSTGLYLGSDGFRHQFGGDPALYPSGKKYSKNRLFNLINELHGIPMYMQAEIIENQLDAWKGHHEQTDDICLIGIRL